MMRSYELMFVVDPRTSEEDAKSLANDFKNQVEATGAQVVKKEHMGRRKLAYEIQKNKEGRYFLLYILSEDGGHGFAGVEARMEQHDQILRYMVVRTDEDLKRAGLPLPEPAEEEEVEPEEDVEPEEEEASPESQDDEDDEDDDDDDDDEED